MALIIAGQQIEVHGLRCLSWEDDPQLRLKIGQDGRRREGSVKGITLHTTKGIPGGKDRRPQKILPGLGPAGHAARVARFWSTDPTAAGAHLVVDHDGTIVCLADLAAEVAFHAGPVNETTIGIEIFQGGEAELYSGQLAVVVRLVDFLTARFGIPRKIPSIYRGKPRPWIADGSFAGVYGHRDVTSNRGAGDPGDEIFERLAWAGYEAVDPSRRKG